MLLFNLQSGVHYCNLCWGFILYSRNTASWAASNVLAAFAIKILIRTKKETKLMWWMLQQFINPLSLFTQERFAQIPSPHCPAISLGSWLIACAEAPPPSASPERILIWCFTVGKHCGLLATVAHLSHELSCHGSFSIFRQKIGRSTSGAPWDVHPIPCTERKSLCVRCCPWEPLQSTELWGGLGPTSGLPAPCRSDPAKDCPAHLSSVGHED